jgi:hypothetical protein
MSRWYRAYEGTVADPKLAEAALVANVSRSVAIACWHAILESAAAEIEGGKFGTTPRRVAITLAEPLAPIEAVFAALAELGMLQADKVTAWDKRQFSSDRSTDRTKAYRERKKTVGNGGERHGTNGEASQDGVVTSQAAVVTDHNRTEQNRVPLDKSNGAEAGEIDPTKLLFDAGKVLLIGGGVKPAQAGAMLGKWRRDHGDEALLAALGKCKREGAIDPAAFIAGCLRAKQRDGPAPDRLGLMVPC